MKNELLIDGQWVAAASKKTFAVINPATEEVITQVADGDSTDGLRALEAAVKAQKSWSAMPPGERGELLRKAFDALTARAQELAEIITLETGKPISESLGEVKYGAEFLRWFAGEATRIDGRYTVSPDGKSRHIVFKRGVGPCLLITPWNFPIAMVTRKVGPALAAGCTLIIKPSELTPLTALFFAEVLVKAGLPAGVLNVVCTTDAAAVTTPLLEDGRLRKVSFTGSTAVGKKLIAASATKMVRHSMELGGNAPFIVFEDADLDAAVAGAMIAKFRNAGQACTAANRFLVHESIASQFIEKLTAKSREVKIGPMINAKGRQKVDALVQSAVKDGAQLVLGGKVPDGRGYFYPPTVLKNVPLKARILHEEIFGPVAPISTFSTEAEAIAAANDTEHGLSSYFYTRDLNRALRVAEQVQAGMTGINTGLVSDAAAPFGGVKESGLGREGSHEGIEEYLDTHYLNVAT